jgi:uncharacterized membrane protein
VTGESENNGPLQPKRRTLPEKKVHPFRRAVLRGLGVVLPPLLTIVVFLWAWSLISRYVLNYVEGGVRYLIVQSIWDVPEELPTEGGLEDYAQLPNGQWIPLEVYKTVQKYPGQGTPRTPWDYFDRYVQLVYKPRAWVIPVSLVCFVLLLYVLGRFLAAGMGRWMWATFESLIQRLPVIRNVYSSVKQVTDFIFTEQQIEFNRVVAVEYPRKGVWSIGFVTGESMLDIRSAANEPVLTVLMPTSPMPATGFTITVRKSETVDLDITVDEAIQFVVSCGVVVPAHQQHEDGVASYIPSVVSSRKLPDLSATETESSPPAAE